MVWYTFLKLSVTENGLKTNTGLKFNKIILFSVELEYYHPSSHHNELPTNRRKWNNFLSRITVLSGILCDVKKYLYIFWWIKVSSRKYYWVLFCFCELVPNNPSKWLMNFQLFEVLDLIKNWNTHFEGSII